jgi:hypothetical protein
MAATPPPPPNTAGLRFAGRLGLATIGLSVFFMLMFAASTREYLRAATWPTTPGAFTPVADHQPEDAETIRVSYVAGGAAQVVEWSCSPEEYARLVATPGPIIVSYDPADPKKHVFNRRISRAMARDVFPEVLLALAGLVIVTLVRRSAGAMLEARRRAEAEPGRPWRWEADFDDFSARASRVSSGSFAAFFIAPSAVAAWVSALAGWLYADQPDDLVVMWIALAAAVVLTGVALRPLLASLRTYVPGRLRFEQLPLVPGTTARVLLKLRRLERWPQVELTLALDGGGRWTQSWQVALDPAPRAEAGCWLELPIPADQPSRDAFRESAVSWSLTIRSLPGAPALLVAFDLPVYDVDASEIERRELRAA